MSPRLVSGGTIVPYSTYQSTKRRKLENKSDFDDNEKSMVALPGDIMNLILHKLDPVGFHCFGAVCRSWRSIATAAKKTLQPQLPWLMFSSPGSHLPKFFSLSHGKISKPKLLEVRGIRCCGSSWGWLIMAWKTCHCTNMFLLNPFTRIQIQLPTRGGYPGMFDLPSPDFIRKALLLSPPTAAIATTRRSNVDDSKTVVQTMVAHDCVVIAIDCDCCLSFCRLADEAWTLIVEQSFEDIIFYHGEVYAISVFFELVRMDLGPRPRLMSCNIAPPEGEGRDNFGIADKKAVYLVECDGDLLMVIRCWDLFCSQSDPDGFCQCESNHPRRTNVLKVFKLDLKGNRWTPVENLVDQMLFVGSSGGISVSALDSPGFKGNCIYFTDQNFLLLTHACNDTGVFHMEDKSIKPLFLGDDGVSPPFPPVWFSPFSW